MSPIDILKELLEISTDSQLAQRLGYTKQAIATARHRCRISDKMLSVASKETGLDMAELKKLLPMQKKLYDDGPTRNELWEELKRCLDDNRRLMGENRRLAAENEKLKNIGESQ